MTIYKPGDLIHVEFDTVVRAGHDYGEEAHDRVYVDLPANMVRAETGAWVPFEAVTRREPPKPPLPTAFGSAVYGKHQGREGTFVLADDDSSPWRFKPTHPVYQGELDWVQAEDITDWSPINPSA